MSDIKSYKVYQLEQTPKGEYNPSLEKQLQRIREHFKSIYGCEPDELLIGPARSEDSQMVIQEGQVYAAIPTAASNTIVSEGYEFTTGYDTENPAQKT